MSKDYEVTIKRKIGSVVMLRRVSYEFNRPILSLQVVIWSLLGLVSYAFVMNLLPLPHWITFLIVTLPVMLCIIMTMVMAMFMLIDQGDDFGVDFMRQTKRFMAEPEEVGAYEAVRDELREAMCQERYLGKLNEMARLIGLLIILAIMLLAVALPPYGLLWWIGKFSLLVVVVRHAFRVEQARLFAVAIEASKQQYED